MPRLPKLHDQGRSLKYLASRQLPLCLLAMVVTSIALANPQGGNVVSGSATITQSPGETVINQSSQQAILEWKSFNIDANEKTRFVQPSASAIALNRISPNAGPSQIFGQLIANGRIILVNQAGIYFGPNARVDVAGLIASTSDISNANFEAGNFVFDKPGIQPGRIDNAGRLIAAEHGLVALIGNNISNDGTIEAQLGNVVLASGKTFTLNFSNDTLLSFSIGEPIEQNAVGTDGNAGSDAIRNTGSIMANGGTIRITAKAANSVVDNSINLNGIVEANTVAESAGRIILNGSEPGVIIGAALSAIGENTGENGGSIHIDGNQILVTSTASLNTSGKGAGGDILIYGTESAGIHGTLLATGETGNGGSIETSGTVLDTSGIRVNTSSVHGKTGMWLLDPTDITISTSATSNASFSSDTYSSTSSGSTSSNILASDLLNNLASTNVTVSTTNPSGTGNGDIAVNTDLSWSAATTLTLSATRNIYLNADITALNGGLTLIATNGTQSLTGGTIGSGSLGGPVGSVTANINVANFTLSSGQWFQSSASLPSFNVTGNFSIAAGSAYNGMFNAEFTRLNQSSGNGISDIFGLQGIATGPLSESYQLVNNIDATVTSGWNSGSGFVPIGTSSSPFTGIFNGQYNAISNLYIDLPSAGSAGLIGYASGATINNTMMNNASITARNNAGSLVGFLDNGSSVSQSVAINPVITGTPGVSANFGGLVGLNNNGSTISDSYSLGGSVTAYNSVGGFTSYNVNGGATITNSYSTTRVIETNNDGAIGGFLVTNYQSNDNNNYWNTETAGTGQSGGGMGLTTSQMMSQSSFSGWDFTNTWGIIEGQSFPYLKGFYSGGTPRAISGSTGLVAGTSLQLAVNGSLVTNTGVSQATATTGANGFYYFLEPNGAIADSDALLIYATGSTLANAITLAPASGGSLTDISLSSNTVTVGDLNTNTLSNSLISTATGSLSSQLLYSLNNGVLTLTSGTDFSTTANTTWQMDDNDSVTASGTGSLTFNGPVLLGGVTSFNADNGDITFMSTIDGISGSESLNVNSNNNVIFNGDIGSLIAPDTLDVTAGNLVFLNTGSVTTTGSQVWNGSLVPISTTLTSNANNIILNGNSASHVAASWNTNALLTLNAGNAIAINGAITASNGGLILSAAYSPESITTDYTYGAVTVGSFSLLQGEWYQNNSTLPAFSVSGDFSLNAGVIPGNTVQFLRVLGGDGSNVQPWQLTDIFGIQGMGTTGTTLSGSWQLMNSVNATVTQYWNSGSGFIPIGDMNNPFSGSLSGQNHTISHLTINNSSTTTDVGFFGDMSNTASVIDLGLVDLSVNNTAGGRSVGGLAGVAGGTLMNTYVTGNVTSSGSDWIMIGGLAGSSDNVNISNAYSLATVSNANTDGYSMAGGLMGALLGTASITTSFSGGSVTSTVSGVNLNMIGGFAGENQATISNSASATMVTLNSTAGFAGSFVGSNDNYGGGSPIISNSYATGAVLNSNGATLGGFAGQNSGATINNSFWDTDTTGQNTGIGSNSGSVNQLVGGCFKGTCSNGGTVSLSSSTSFSNAGWDMTGTWGIINNASYPWLKALYTGTPRAISGETLFTAGQTIQLTVNGTPVSSNGLVQGTTLTGMNGFYYFLEPQGTVPDSSTVEVSGLSQSANTTAPAAGGSIVDLNIQGTNLILDSFADVTTYGTFSNNVWTVSNPSGLITINGTLSWNTGYTIQLVSPRIRINAAVDSINGTLELSASNTPQSIMTNYTNGTINVYNFVLQQGQWYQVNAALPAFAVSNDFVISGGTLPAAAAQFIRALGGNGSTANPFQLTDIYGVQGIGSSSTTLSNHYVLANDINAAPVQHWNSGAGFIPIGNQGTPFSGSLDGASHTISNLYTNNVSAISNVNDVGLFGVTAAASVIENLSLDDVSFYEPGSTWSVAGLVGNNSGTLSNVQVTGSVSAPAAGGLVGLNQGSISEAFSNVSVNVTDAGGSGGGFVISNNYGTINAAFSSGSVTGSGDNTCLGGFACYSVGGSIANSGTTSAVIATNTTANSYIGGFIGQIDSTGGPSDTAISDSYSAGLVSATGTSTASTGGFAGVADSNQLSGNFWDTDMSGQSSGIGQNNAGASVQGGCFGSVCTNGGTVSLSSLDTWLNAGWDMTSTWGLIDGGSYPWLQALYSVTPRVIRGTSNLDAGTFLQLAINGINLTNTGVSQGTAIIGANQSYYFLEPSGSPADGDALLVYATGSAAANAISLAPQDGGSIGNLGLNSHTVVLGDENTNVLTSDILSTAAGSLSTGVLYSALNGNITMTADTSLSTTETTTLNMTGGTTIASSGTGNLLLSGPVSSTGSLSFTAGNGLISVTNTSNSLSGPLSLTNTGNHAVTLNNASDTTLTSSTLGGNVTINSDGTLFLNGSLSAGGNITLVTRTSFMNMAGNNPLQPGAGARALIWSVSPDNDINTGISQSFRQYSATYGITPVADTTPTDNGLLFSVSASLTPILTGSVTKLYDQTTSATLSAANYGVTGALGGDTVIWNNPVYGTYASKGAGSQIPVTVSGIVAVSVTNNGVPVYGYTVTGGSATASIGTIQKRTLTATGITANSKTFNGSTLATLSLQNAILYGVLPGDSVSLNPYSYLANFVNQGPGTSIPVTVSYISLTGADSLNYLLSPPVDLSAAINPSPNIVIATLPLPPPTVTSSFDSTVSSSSSSSSGTTSSVPLPSALSSPTTVQSVNNILSSQSSIDSQQTTSTRFGACY